MSNKAHLMTGYSKNRRPYDFYSTPPARVMALLENETFSGSIFLEPCSGAGHISKVLEKKFPGQNILSYDIRKDNIYGTGGIDFLKQTAEFYNHPDHIITNPPYKILTEFIQHSKTIARYKIAMLLPTQALGGKIHNGLIWTDKQFPLKKVIIIPDRLKFFSTKNSCPMYHLWAIWDRFHVGEPIITWHQKKENTLPLFPEGEEEQEEDENFKDAMETEVLLLQKQIEIESEVFCDA
ncbi:MAG TPA: hypothetical protein PKJ95_02345 [Atribacterota bacterium]|nr:hypothetical protein [Atribacterota bacterium]